MAVAQWVRRWSSGHKVVQAEVRARVEIYTNFFFSNDFYFSFVGPKDFSVIVILCSRPNSCCLQNLKCFDMPFLSVVFFFHERVATTVKQMFFKSQAGLGPQCPICAGMLLSIACQGKEDYGSKPSIQVSIFFGTSILSVPARFCRIIHQQAQVSSFETFYSNPESLTIVLLSKYIE